MSTPKRKFEFNSKTVLTKTAKVDYNPNQITLAQMTTRSPSPPETNSKKYESEKYMVTRGVPKYRATSVTVSPQTTLTQMFEVNTHLPHPHQHHQSSSNKR